jgi:hypothetical protein
VVGITGGGIRVTNNTGLQQTWTIAFMPMV